MDNKRNWVIGGLLLAIILMTIGYAALSQELQITGTAGIDADWNVEITTIALDDSYRIDQVTMPDYTATTATFNINLLEPSAFAEYRVEINNNGTIDAKVSTIEVIQSTDVPDVYFEVTGIEVDDELPVGANHTLNVYVEWDPEAEYVPEEPDPISETLTVTILYGQDIE